MTKRLGGGWWVRGAARNWETACAPVLVHLGPLEVEAHDEVDEVGLLGQREVAAVQQALARVPQRVVHAVAQEARRGGCGDVVDVWAALLRLPVAPNHGGGLAAEARDGGGQDAQMAALGHDHRVRRLIRGGRHHIHVNGLAAPGPGRAELVQNAHARFHRIRRCLAAALRSHRRAARVNERLFPQRPCASARGGPCAVGRMRVGRWRRSGHPERALLASTGPCRKAMLDRARGTDRANERQGAHEPRESSFLSRG